MLRYSKNKEEARLVGDRASGIRGWRKKMANHPNRSKAKIQITRKEFDALLALKLFVDSPASFGCTIDLGTVDRGFGKRVGHIFKGADVAVSNIQARNS